MASFDDIDCVVPGPSTSTPMKRRRIMHQDQYEEQLEVLEYSAIGSPRRRNQNFVITSDEENYSSDDASDIFESTEDVLSFPEPEPNEHSDEQQQDVSVQRG